ncbi:MULTISPECIES: hypothetical protein [Sphingobacterium]|mgnify:FL=1|uniref:hypothetical protein n=1 Tax=Sphingobacterium TaxID=28453 RepID=UPI000C0BC283|nr:MULTISPECIES: hypothetical protein [Sphingobacterium]MCT1531075.1 hypothetical protein [Sphingobacterium daejeonense]
MKMNMLKFALIGAVVSTISFSSCSKDSGPDTENEDNVRWVTVSGALMDTEPGDGNAGTMVFAMKPEDAKNPAFSVNVFDQGQHVKSSRTARLQASSDGKYLYNIQYTGDDGGMFQKYRVRGGKTLVPEGPEVHTATYVSTSPRWLKAAEGIGVAVRGTGNDVVYTGEKPNFVYKERSSKIDVISLDLNNPKINKTTSYELKLTPEEIEKGYYVSRIDVPVINKAGNKVFIGAAVTMDNKSSFTIGTDGKPTWSADRTGQKSWAKTLVLDYPSLTNPKVLTSNKTRGNTNGYRSTMQYVGTDGHVYQATSGEAKGDGGSKILRISSATNDYDNSFAFSLDQALGVKDSYIETWKYVGDGIGFVVYNIAGKGGYIARIDLKNNTAKKYTIPNETELNFRQIQNISLEGDDVFIAIAPVGKDGNIYVFNRKTGDMVVGAKLINKTGNQYIGVY